MESTKINVGDVLFCLMDGRATRLTVIGPDASNTEPPDEWIGNYYYCKDDRGGICNVATDRLHRSKAVVYRIEARERLKAARYNEDMAKRHRRIAKRMMAAAKKASGKP
jgi:hypothetical protein